jgi:hypothetical protein
LITRLDVPTLLGKKGTGAQQTAELKTVVADVDKTLRANPSPTKLSYDIYAGVQFDTTMSKDAAKANGQDLAKEVMAAIARDGSDQPSHSDIFHYDKSLDKYTAISGNPAAAILQFVPDSQGCVTPSPS